VSEKGGQHWKLSLDIGALAVPVEERPDREPMSEVVHAWPGVIAQPA
jgi:hypothetical protein